MGLYCKIDVVSDWYFPQFTTHYQTFIPYDDIIIDVAQKINTEMARTVPVNTGYLQSTLQCRLRDGTTLEAETLCEYAQYVEYGTIKMNAQPYFEPALQLYFEELYIRAFERCLEYQLADMERKLAELEGQEEAQSEKDKNAISYPEESPPSWIKTTPSGQVTAQTWQTAQPDMYREGTTMHTVAVQRQSQLTQYTTDEGRQLNQEYMPKIHLSSSGGMPMLSGNAAATIGYLGAFILFTMIDIITAKMLAIDETFKDIDNRAAYFFPAIIIL